MAMTTVLPPDRADSLRRLLLILAGLVGLATAAFLLSSQPTIDFLREGPARLLPFKGDEARLVLGIGAGIASIVAVAALWRGVTITSLIVAAIALGAGFSLVHVVFTPTLGLVVLAVVVDLAGSIQRAQLAELGPRRYPGRWAAGAVVGVIGLVAFAAISWWLASPLFDEGERVEEGLGFAGRRDAGDRDPDTGRRNAGHVHDRRRDSHPRRRDARPRRSPAGPVTSSRWVTSRAPTRSTRRAGRCSWCAARTVR